MPKELLPSKLWVIFINAKGSSVEACSSACSVVPANASVPSSSSSKKLKFKLDEVHPLRLCHRPFPLSRGPAPLVLPVDGLLSTRRLALHFSLTLMVFAPPSLSRLEASARLSFLLTGLFFQCPITISSQPKGAGAVLVSSFPVFANSGLTIVTISAASCKSALPLMAVGPSSNLAHSSSNFSGFGVAALLILLLVDPSTYTNCLYCRTAAFLPLTARSNTLRIKGNSGNSSSSFW